MSTVKKMSKAFEHSHDATDFQESLNISSVFADGQTVLSENELAVIRHQGDAAKRMFQQRLAATTVWQRGIS